MKYEGITPITRQRAEEALKGNDVEEIVHVLLSITNYERDWEWVQDWALSLLGSPSPAVRKTAIICLGHLARIHGQIDRPRVLLAFEKLRSDPEYAGQIEDALEDIEMFTPDAA